MKNIDVSILREFVSYEPISGKFYWKLRDAKWFRSEKQAEYWNKTYAFRECLKTRDAQQYNVGSIQDKQIYAHRAAWAIVHGEWPEHEIDHLNGVRHDNRLQNLRHVTKTENGRNQGLKATNKSGVNGVFWDKRRNRWVANYRRDDKTITVGAFHTFDEAVEARRAADFELGFHPNHGQRPAVPDYKTHHLVKKIC